MKDPQEIFEDEWNNLMGVLTKKGECSFDSKSHKEIASIFFLLGGAIGIGESEILAKEALIDNEKLRSN